MPTRMISVSAKRFLKYKGVEVFHTYHDGDIDQGVRECHFSTEASHDYDAVSIFDVRKLSTWNEPVHPPFLVGACNTPEVAAAWEEYRESRAFEKSMAKAIRDAIDRGLLGTPGDEMTGGDTEWRCPHCNGIVEDEGEAFCSNDCELSFLKQFAVDPYDFYPKRPVPPPKDAQKVRTEDGRLFTKSADGSWTDGETTAPTLEAIGIPCEEVK